MPVEAERRSVPRHIDVEVDIAKEQNPRDAGLEQIGEAVTLCVSGMPWRPARDQ